MSRWGLTPKECFWKIVALVLSYSGVYRVIHTFVNRFARATDASIRTGFPYVRKRQSRCFQILTYHRVNDENDYFFPGVPSLVFGNHMERLAANFTVCRLSELIEGMERGEIPENAVAITFDDGYRDNFLNAFPILQRLSLPATIFLATGAIGTKQLLWHDKVFFAFRETRALSLVDFGNNIGSLALASLQEKVAAQKIVLEFLWAQTDDERELWIARLLERLEVTNRTEQHGLMLSWDEVRIMHEKGIEFGSHTVGHPVLSRLSEQRIREEVENSKITIEKYLGTPVMTFAFPVGRGQDINPATRALLREAGYRGAVTTISGSNGIDQDRFELRRIMPWAQDPDTFQLRLLYYKFAS